MTDTGSGSRSVAVQLPPPDDPDYGGGPWWSCPHGEVAAHPEGIMLSLDIQGTVTTRDAVDDLERAALAVLAAVAHHRTLTGEAS